MCATSEWSSWSSCSTTCGKGYESRTRRFYNRMGIKKCPHVDIAERRNCAGSVAVCPQYRGSGMLANPDCAVTTWSDWSPCSVSCGKKNENFTLQTWEAWLGKQYVKISGIFCHSEDFTWNQFWSAWSSKNCYFAYLSSSEYWTFGFFYFSSVKFLNIKL